MKLKILFHTIVLLFSVSGFSQELFVYDVDENLSMKVPDDSGEGEMQGQTFIKGSIGEDSVIISKSNKGHEKFDEKSDLTKYFQGIKDGIIKSSKGKILKDTTVEIGKQKVLNFGYSIDVEGQPKVVDSYIFMWKKLTYTIQFVSSPTETPTFKSTKKEILDSIDLK